MTTETSADRRKRKVLEILQDKKCKHCGKLLSEQWEKYEHDYRKARVSIFCSRSCTTIYNHKNNIYQYKQHKKRKERSCFFCGKMLKNSRFASRFCNSECKEKYKIIKDTDRNYTTCFNCHTQFLMKNGVKNNNGKFCGEWCDANYNREKPLHEILPYFFALCLEKRVIEDYYKRPDMITKDGDQDWLIYIENELKKLNVHRSFYV